VSVFFCLAGVLRGTSAPAPGCLLIGSRWVMQGAVGIRHHSGKIQEAACQGQGKERAQESPILDVQREEEKFGRENVRAQAKGA
jgi:hypothetical protein